MVSSEEHRSASEPRTRLAYLRCERLSRRGSWWAGSVSLTWLVPFMVERFAACPEHLHAQSPVNPTAVVLRRLAAEAEEMWSVVPQKAHKPWIWSAIAAKTRQILALPGGARRRDRATPLWAEVPMGDRAPALCPTDHDEADQGVMPPPQHNASTTYARNTTPIERFHHTWRQRVAHLVRDTLSCPKQLANQIGARKYFLCHDNLPKTTA